MARPTRYYVKNEVIEVAVHGEINAPEWSCAEENIPESLDGFISWLQDVRERILAEHRPTAEVEVDAHGVITVTYKRPMTDAEVQKRMADDLTRQMIADDHERALYERLKAKYEP